MTRRLALACLLACLPAFASENIDGPVRVLSVKPLKLPWASTRASWERTKELSADHWKMIPLAQIATAAFFVKTALSTPYDLAAAPFRKLKRNKVRFQIEGRIVDGEGKPAAGVDLLVRCTTPWEASEQGRDFSYYETGRFGPAHADADGRVKIEGEGLTGLGSKFMLHLDLSGAGSGGASAGAYAIAISSGSPEIGVDLPGPFRLVRD